MEGSPRRRERPSWLILTTPASIGEENRPYPRRGRGIASSSPALREMPYRQFIGHRNLGLARELVTHGAGGPTHNCGRGPRPSWLPLRVMTGPCRLVAPFSFPVAGPEEKATVEPRSVSPTRFPALSQRVLRPGGLPAPAASSAPSCRPFAGGRNAQDAGARMTGADPVSGPKASGVDTEARLAVNRADGSSSPRASPDQENYLRKSRVVGTSLDSSYRADDRTAPAFFASLNRSTSRMGGPPKSRLYSRLNCDASS
jgi:hypothetical protein